MEDAVTETQTESDQTKSEVVPKTSKTLVFHWIGTVTSFVSKHAWRNLYQISLFTWESYEACQRICSGEFHTLEVYALYKLANHVEEPIRSRAKSLVGKALLFRNDTVPKNNLPLNMMFLAHDNFGSNLETWIRKLIIQRKNVAIPFFYRLIDSENKVTPSWAVFKVFYTIIDACGQRRTLDRSIPCCCRELRSIAKQHISQTGHLAIMHNFVYNRPSPLTWFDSIHGASEKLLHYRMALSF